MNERTDRLAEGAALRAQMNYPPRKADAEGAMAAFGEHVDGHVFAELWARPGLDPRTRSAVTIGMAIADGYWDALAMHITAGLANGLTRHEIEEIILHTAAYAGVTAAAAGFRVARGVFGEPDQLS